MHLRKDRGWLALQNVPTGDGELAKCYLGLRDTKGNRLAAEQTKRAIENEIRAGQWSAARFASFFPNAAAAHRLAASSPKQTLGDFARAWLEQHGGELHPATRADYGYLLKHVYAHPIAEKPLGAVHDGYVEEFKQALREKGLGPRRINLVLERLRSVFKAAARRKLISEDPMLYVKPERLPKPEVNPFDVQEVGRLLDCAREPNKRLLTVLIFAGLRPNELFALGWEYVDFVREVICVRRNATRYGIRLPKTAGSEREVEMASVVKQALQAQRACSQLKGALVFPSAAGTPIDLINFRARVWRPLLARAGLAFRPLYQCRHTFARLALERGANPQWVAAQLGHATLQMLFRHYGRWLKPTSGREALERAAVERSASAQPVPHENGDSGEAKVIALVSPSSRGHERA